MFNLDRFRTLRLPAILSIGLGMMQGGFARGEMLPGETLEVRAASEDRFRRYEMQWSSNVVTRTMGMAPGHLSYGPGGDDLVGTFFVREVCPGEKGIGSFRISGSSRPEWILRPNGQKMRIAQGDALRVAFEFRTVGGGLGAVGMDWANGDPVEVRVWEGGPELKVERFDTRILLHLPESEEEWTPLVVEFRGTGEAQAGLVFVSVESGPSHYPAFRNISVYRTRL